MENWQSKSVYYNIVFKVRSQVQLHCTMFGSVLARMPFPLHASDISDESETGGGKHISVPAEFCRSKKFCTGGAKI